MPLPELLQTAREVNRRLHRGTVTYVVNRNCNFTNVCNVGCTFCGFMRRAGDEDARTHSPAQVVERLLQTPWVGEVCMQGGINPELGLEDHLALVRAIKDALPGVHLHAFSPMEVHNLTRCSGRPVRDILLALRDAGVGSIPGTAAEILVDRVRKRVSGNKLDADRWEEIIRAAHGIGLRSTATIMYGHVESWHHIRLHFERLHRIQLDTGGFTELVPLTFIPYRNRLGAALARMGAGGHQDFTALENRSLRIARRLYPLARVYFQGVIDNLQTSWVKLGPQLAAESLHWGCNDFGGTLYEESITRESGGPHGEMMTPEQIEAHIRSVGLQPQRRDTLYRHVGEYCVGQQKHMLHAAA